MHPIDLRRDAVAIHAAGVAGADPAPCTAAAIARDIPTAPVWLVAVGKAGPAMASGAVQALRQGGARIAGGLVVGPTAEPVPAPLTLALGDHPLPRSNSRAAADALADLCGRIAPTDAVRILISGGASSLIAAPIDGLSDADFGSLHRMLSRAGLPIDRLNSVRKRFARFGAGRLRLALAASDVQAYCISDVPGDAPRDIGSGPCDADPATAQEIRAILDGAKLWDLLPGSVRAIIERTEARALPETPKPGHPALAGSPTIVVASNRNATLAAAAAARALGYDTSIEPTVLAGDAAESGRRIATTLVTLRDPGAHAIIWGGETTVRLGPDAGAGGRCQELALAAALVLADRASDRVVLLAAGTDGRDGPTDAAGALVSAATASAIRAAGLDPAEAVRRHDAYPALDAAGALLRTGPTGTNVMDLVIGLVGP